MRTGLNTALDPIRRSSDAQGLPIANDNLDILLPISHNQRPLHSIRNLSVKYKPCNFSKLQHVASARAPLRTETTRTVQNFLTMGIRV